ncbi:hypothetical protein D3C85_1041870 [compost metagenome]
MSDFFAGAIQPEYLPHVADDVADGLVLQSFRQRVLHPFLQVQVIDLINLNTSPARPDMDLGLVGVAPVGGGGDVVDLDFQPEVQVVAEGVFDQLGRVGKPSCGWQTVSIC